MYTSTMNKQKHYDSRIINCSSVNIKNVTSNRKTKVLQKIIPAESYFKWNSKSSFLTLSLPRQNSKILRSVEACFGRRWEGKGGFVNNRRKFYGEMNDGFHFYSM